jgi:hypothetical protein
MSDYISNSIQQRILEDIADEEADVHKYSAAENFIVNDESLSVVFAMAIGYADFLSLTEKAPFNETKSKNYTPILAKEVMRRVHFMFHGTYEKPDDNPLFNKVSKQLCMPKPTGCRERNLLPFLKKKQSNYSLWMLLQREDTQTLRKFIETVRLSCCSFFCCCF